MPMSKNRRKLEVPAELYEAVAQAAADVGMPAATYASALLWESLQRRRRDLAPAYPFEGKKPYQRRRDQSHMLASAPDAREDSMERPDGASGMITYTYVDVDDVISRLTTECGYTQELARRIAQRLGTADDRVKGAFWRWWQTGDVDNSVEIAGYTPARLIAERAMSPLSAYSTLDLLQQEPAETLRALEKGHDTVIPRKRPALTEKP